jgi:ferric-dicitrate binding protein FerR (iron transport regulator)
LKNVAHAKPFQRAMALVMCFLLSPFHQFAVADSGGGERVGKITGVVAAAAQSGARLNLQDPVSAKSELTTDESGRLRIQLEEGSILSVGSGSHLSILKQNLLTGETLVDLSSGRLRSRVTRVRKAGGKFEILTPHARITALGTDFFLDVSPARTYVVVYTGVVVVSSGRESDSSGSRLVMDVAAGQNVVVQGKDVSHLQMTADEVERATIAQTAIQEELASEEVKYVSAGKTQSHTSRNLLIAVAVAAGAIGGGLAAKGGGSKSSTTTTPVSIPSIPGH